MLRYVRYLLVKGLRISLIGTGLAILLAYYKGWEITWSYLQQANFLIFLLTGALGVWIGLATGPNEIHHSVGSVSGQINRDLWADHKEDGYVNIQPLSTGWRLFVMSFTSLGVTILIRILRIWV